ncbi:MAG: hypothetical protein R3C97_14960 [Geminicoccaceae bacterium]
MRRQNTRHAAADIAWIEDGSALAENEGASAIVLGIHADIFRKKGFDRDSETFKPGSGYAAFGEKLAELVAAYGKPVLLIFGDNHKFRVFHPFPRRAANLLALEVFGAEHMHAVRVDVDTDLADPFGIRAIMNPAYEID